MWSAAAQGQGIWYDNQWCLIPTKTAWEPLTMYYVHTVVSCHLFDIVVSSSSWPIFVDIPGIRNDVRL